MPASTQVLADAAHALRSLRRSWRHSAGTVLTLAFGGGVSLAMATAAWAGLGWTAPADPPVFGRLPNGAPGGWTDGLRSAAELQGDGYRAIFVVLLAAAIAVALVTCVNAAAHVVIRASARRHERAMRVALGATQLRLAVQALVENGTLALAGVLGAAAVGAVLLKLLRASWPAAGGQLAGHAGAGPLLLALALPAGAVLLFGIAPALRAGGGNLHARLTTGNRATADRYEGWLRRTITIAQLATSMGLLVGAGVLIRSSLPGTTPPSPGFDPRDTLTLRLDTPATLAADPSRRTAALQSALERIRAIPGVRAAAFGSPDAWLGLGPRDKVTTWCDECSLANVWTPILVGPARNLSVSEGWFGTLGVRVLKGRALTDADRGRRVVVINQAFAGLLYPRGEPIGKMLAPMGFFGTRYTVVGVVDDVAPSGPGTPRAKAAALYLPAGIHPPTAAAVAVRAAGDPVRLAPAVRAAIRAAIPGARVSEVMTMEARLARYRAPLGWFGVVLCAVAVAALLLCVGAVYSVVAYGVARRTREIGVRMALGAREGQVVRHVLGGGVRLARAGAIFGALLAIGTGQTVAWFFRGVPVLDPATLLAVAAVLGGAAVAASWLPARRAARLDPLEALRAE
ncbi:MAG TPA: FtsX-like permease family protein [Longimicrobium sp.]|nr:FtsX-like permease family protein [Longimicrobium sp.]